MHSPWLMVQWFTSSDICQENRGIINQLVSCPFLSVSVHREDKNISPHIWPPILRRCFSGIYELRNCLLHKLNKTDSICLFRKANLQIKYLKFALDEQGEIWIWIELDHIVVGNLPPSRLMSKSVYKYIPVYMHAYIRTNGVLISHNLCKVTKYKSVVTACMCHRTWVLERYPSAPHPVSCLKNMVNKQEVSKIYMI